MVVRIRTYRDILEYGKSWYSRDYAGIYDIVFNVYLRKIYSGSLFDYYDGYRNITYKFI